MRLRRTRALQEDGDLSFYYKVGVERGCGVRGTRLVRPKLWMEVPKEALEIKRWVSGDGRWLNVEVRWVGACDD